MSTGGCVMYSRVHYSVQQDHRVTSCTQWLAYISMCGRRLSFLAPVDSLIFQCAAGGWCSLHPVTCWYFNVRQTVIISCTQFLAYKSACSRRVLHLACSDSHFNAEDWVDLSLTDLHMVSGYKSTNCGTVWPVIACCMLGNDKSQPTAARSGQWSRVAC